MFIFKVKCCGAEGPDSWKNSTYVNQNIANMKAKNESTYALFPDSCCIKSGCNMGASESDYSTVKDVYTKVRNYLYEQFSEVEFKNNLICNSTFTKTLYFILLTFLLK